jgi:hypothetical protein
MELDSLPHAISEPHAARAGIWCLGVAAFRNGIIAEKVVPISDGSTIGREDADIYYVARVLFD